jgi:hypothetical protein
MPPHCRIFEPSKAWSYNHTSFDAESQSKLFTVSNAWLWKVPRPWPLQVESLIVLLHHLIQHHPNRLVRGKILRNRLPYCLPARQVPGHKKPADLRRLRAG